MGTSPSPPPPDFSGIKAIFFDFMGTCLDWHTSIVASLPSRIPQATRSALALALREAFFSDIHARFEANLPPEPIDETHARLLAGLLDTAPFSPATGVTLSTAERAAVVRAWHAMAAWPDVAPALAALHAKGYELFVLANGTTRLQLNLARSSGLGASLDMLFSSQLLGLTKPDPELYRVAMRLVGVAGDEKPGEALMVAAHAYDLRAARKVGMRTIYVRRWTEDTLEDMEAVRRDVDCFLGGVGGGGEQGCEDGSLEGLVALL